MTPSLGADVIPRFEADVLPNNELYVLPTQARLYSQAATNSPRSNGANEAGYSAGVGLMSAVLDHQHE